MEMIRRYRELPKVTVYYLLITFVVATATQSRIHVLSIIIQLTSNGSAVLEFTAPSSFRVVEYVHGWNVIFKDETDDPLPLLHGQSVDWISHVEYLWHKVYVGVGEEHIQATLRWFRVDAPVRHDGNVHRDAVCAVLCICRDLVEIHDPLLLDAQESLFPGESVHDSPEGDASSLRSSLRSFPHDCGVLVMMEVHL